MLLQNINKAPQYLFWLTLLSQFFFFFYLNGLCMVYSEVRLWDLLVDFLEKGTKITNTHPEFEKAKY